jgi:hypothetical protein
MRTAARLTYGVDLDNSFSPPTRRRESGFGFHNLGGRQISDGSQQGVQKLGRSLLHTVSPEGWERLYWPFQAKRRQTNTIC